jgi:hypothetical protein
MAENLNLGLTVQAWANIVIERWETKLVRLKVRNTGKLIDSFYSHVRYQANGNPELILFTFEYYGKFLDMGVGRGVTYEQVESSGRKRYPWYNRMFYSQMAKLREILAAKYEMKAQISIADQLDTSKNPL